MLYRSVLGLCALLCCCVAPASALAETAEVNTVTPSGAVVDSTEVSSVAEAEAAVTEAPTPTSGALRGTGSNGSGQLGLGVVGSETVFQVAGEDLDWKAAATGHDFSCAIRTNGTLWCWGSPTAGKLGLGDSSRRLAPAQVGREATWTTVTAGRDHACATQTNGTLWCWGDGAYGKLGSGDTTNRATPVQVPGGGWKAASATIDSTCAVKQDGTLWCWGYNGSGQLGNGTSTNQRVPVQAGTDTDWATLAAVKYATCATKTDTSMWCWGYNAVGQLGVGDTSSRTSPTKVLTPVTATALAGGAAADHTLVITQDTAAVNACQDLPTSQAFSQLGDVADYALAPAGDFEGATDGWTLDNARVVPGNETVGILAGSRSLLLGDAATAPSEVVLPEFCLNETHPHFRFTLKSNASTGTLYTAVRFRPKHDPVRVIEVVSRANITTVGGWGASPEQPLATRIAASLLAKGGTVQLVFRTSAATNAKGGVQVDNVLVDPYRTR